MSTKIIKIEKINLKFKKNMFKIFFADKTDLMLCADTIVKFGLKIDLDITDDKYKKIISYDKSNRVISEALRLVSKRSYSNKNLQAKLIQKGYDIESAEKAAVRLKELNYINDEKFAEIYASYLLKKGRGEFAIKTALREQGIEKNLINNALKTIKTDCQPYEQIIKMMKTKFKNFNGKDKNEIRRVASFFLRRGFSFEDISKAVREYKDISIE
jgi:regulatory protein